MSVEVQDRIILGDLHPLEYEHPFDTKAMGLLQGTPGLERISKTIFKAGLEKWAKVQCTGSNLLVTEKNLPELNRCFNDTCHRIALAQIPQLYLRHSIGIQAGHIGAEEPLIALNAFAVDRLTEAELEIILGRQAGHIKSRHSLYTMMAEIMGASGGFGVGFAGGITSAIISDIPGMNILTTAATKPIEWALNFWMRMAEFTADRTGLLACQNMDMAISALVKTAGLPLKYAENDCNESFIEQAREFEQMDSKWMNKLFKMMRPDPSINWTVLRASELLKWVESGEYESVLSRESRSKVQMARDGGLIICRTCSYRLTGSEKFCPCCGSAMSITPNISAQKKNCPSCSFEIKGNEKFCPGCGENLN